MAESRSRKRTDSQVARIRRTWRRNKDNFFRIFSLFVFAAAILTVIYYILFPGRYSFHADCGDTLVWAQASYESGQLISGDFTYAAILPIGGSLLMLPWIPLFGVSMTTHMIGMITFSLLFTGALFFFFRSFSFSMSWSFLCTGMVLLLLSGGNSLREMFWGHVIYYSLGPIYLTMGIGLMIRFYYFQTQRQNRYLLLYAILLCCAAMNGFQIVAIVILPIIGALFADLFFDKREFLWNRKNLCTSLILLVSTASTMLGLLLLQIFRNGNYASYADAYSSFSEMDSWQDHIASFWISWISLFGVRVEEGESLISGNTIVYAIQLFAAGLFLILPVYVGFHYREIRSRSLRLLLWCHYMVSAFVLFGYIFGKLSAANWRLIPILFSSVLLTLVYIKNQISTLDFKRIPVLLLTILLCLSFVHVFFVSQLPANYKESDLYVISETLKEKNLLYGYGTFWQANAIPIISNGEVTMRCIDIDEERGYEPRAYQTSPSWYQPNPEIQECFLLLTETEYSLLQESDNWDFIEESITDEFIVCQYYTVLVLDKNIF